VVGFVSVIEMRSTPSQTVRAIFKRVPPTTRTPILPFAHVHVICVPPRTYGAATRVKARSGFLVTCPLGLVGYFDFSPLVWNPWPRRAIA
jgi:hypothetical protein